MFNRIKNTNLFFLGLVVFYVALCFLIIPYLPDKILEGNCSIILGQLIIALPGIVYLIVEKGKPLTYIKCKKLKISDYIILFFFTMFFIPVISFINAISMMFVENYIATELDSMNNNPLLLNIILIAFIPAIVEEITFRGIIYGGYKGGKTKYAILASALLFGLFHMNINQLSYAFVMAIFFCLIYESTGSILSTIFVHFIFNSNSVIIQKLVSWYEKYIIELAKNNDSYKELANSITSSEQTTGYTNMSIADKISTLSSLIIPAIIGVFVACILLNVLAERNHRKIHLKKIVYSFIGKEYMDEKNIETEYKEDIDGDGKSKIIDIVFVSGVILCILFMIFLEL